MVNCFYKQCFLFQAWKIIFCSKVFALCCDIWTVSCAHFKCLINWLLSCVSQSLLVTCTCIVHAVTCTCTIQYVHVHVLLIISFHWPLQLIGNHRAVCRECRVNLCGQSTVQYNFVNYAFCIMFILTDNLTRWVKTMNTISFLKVSPNSIH